MALSLMLSAIRNCFKSQSANDRNHRNGYRRLSDADPDNAMFEDALHNHLDQVVPRSRQAKARTAKVSAALDVKLMPKNRGQAADAASTSMQDRLKTGFKNIFKHARPSSPDAEFGIALNDNQTVYRSRHEVKTHVLLKSHLYTAHGDRSISKSDVLSVNEVLCTPRHHWLSGRAVPSDQSETVPSSSLHRGATTQPQGKACGSAALTADKPVLTNRRDAASPPRPRADPTPLREAIPPPPIVAHLPAATPNVPETPPRQRPSQRLGASTQPPNVTNHNPAQQEFIRFMEERLESTPLDFFDDVVRRDPVVAAFFAVQTAKMTTSTGQAVPSNAVWGPSRHPLVELRARGEGVGFQGHDLQIRDREIRGQGAPLNAKRSAMISALLDDLRTEIDRQNMLVQTDAGPSFQNRDSVLPLGIPTIAAPVHSAGDHLEDAAAKRETSVKLSEMFQRIARPDARDHVRTVEDIAAISPAAAAAFGLVDHLLTIQGPTPATTCERYHYAEVEASISDFAEKGVLVDQRWMPTFIPGIQRKFGRSAEAPDAYRVMVSGQWQEGKSRANIFGIVASDALHHLQSTGKTTPDQALYPLALYELVAKAADIALPDYLKVHENEVLAQVDLNRARKSANKTRIAELQEKTRIEREVEEAKLVQRLFDFKVTSVFQLVLILNHGLNDEKIKANSIECSFTLTPKNGNPLDFIRAIQTNHLEKTHTRQAISKRRGHGRGVDNKCWLRSTWIPILSNLTPEELADRYRMMHKNSSSIDPIDVKKLQAIAQQFKDDPVAFLHPEGTGESWIHQTGRGARLGPELPPSPADEKREPGSPIKQSHESFLKTLQLGVAAAFRSRENPSLMRELESLCFPGTQASSDLPALLHQAFGVPSLIIEAGEPTTDSAGNPSTLAPRIRVVGPAGSELARLISETAMENKSLDEGSDLLNKILTHFSNLPIVWLEREHFDVYIPNAQIHQ